MQISLWRLFIAFAQIGLSGFGSTVVYARHVVVEDWKWMTEDEFLDSWALCQLVPGPNMVNWSICVGSRFRGIAGALAAALGLVVPPVGIALLLGALHTRYGDVPAIQAALKGIAATAAGLLIATAVKMAATRRMLSWLAVFAVFAFLAVGVARVSLALVLAVLMPLSILAAWLKARRARA